MKITFHVVCGLAISALGGCAYKSLSAPCSMDEGGGPAKSAQVEAAAACPGEPASHDSGAVLCGGGTRARFRAVRSRWGRGLRAAASDHLGNAAMTFSAQPPITGLIPTLLGSVDQTGCNYVQGAYQALSTAVTSGGSGASVASFLYTLRYILGVWRLVGNRDRLRHRCRVSAVSRVCDLYARDLLERFRQLRLHAFQHRPVGDRQSAVVGGRDNLLLVA